MRDGTSVFELYEHAVTGGAALAKFLEAVHGGGARMLAEDFSGSAALARAWVGLSPAHRALAVDLDREALAHVPPGARLRVRRADVMSVREKADIVAATNFPICYWHTRDALLGYLRHVRTRLKAGGVFVADLYGGPSALTVGKRSKRVPLPRAESRTERVLHYTWDQQRVDPLTMRVFNAIHFRVAAGGKTIATHRNAFTYDWRLWSIPELTDAMREAGFGAVEVHDRMGAAIDHLGRVQLRPVSAGEMDADYVVYVAARG